MSRMAIAISAILICLSFTANLAYCETIRKMRDFSQEELVDLSIKSYIAYGSSMTTARLIFQGLWNNKLDPGMMVSMASFFTETQPEVAAVLYYFLYEKRLDFGSDLLDRFMATFSDAMDQYGLSKHRTKKGPLTIGDICNYEDFDFDIESLSKHAKTVIPEFGSLETFIFVMQSKLGMMCGFVENRDTRAIKDYLPENVRLTKDYKKWLDSFPKEVENLMSMFKK
jgi:hypothetical protein